MAVPAMRSTPVSGVPSKIKNRSGTVMPLSCSDSFGGMAVPAMRSTPVSGVYLKNRNRSGTLL